MDAGGRATQGAVAGDTHPPEKKPLVRNPPACRKAGPRRKPCCVTDPKETHQPEVPLSSEAAGYLPASRLELAGKRKLKKAGHVWRWRPRSPRVRGDNEANGCSASVQERALDPAREATAGTQAMQRNDQPIRKCFPLPDLRTSKRGGGG